jgi:hypothetical protein
MLRLVLVLVGALLAAPPAFAHAFLSHASPSAGSETHVPPAAVTIVFTERVEPRFSSIEVRDAAGTKLPTGQPLAQGKAETLTIDLPKLAPGTYTVIWHAASVDTHKTEGKYSFTVLP